MRTDFISRPLVVEARAEISVAGPRPENQDRIRRFLANSVEILLLADGVGGERGGAAAAELAVSLFPIHFRNLEGDAPLTEAIETAVRRVNEEVYRQGHGGDPALTNMAATLVVAGLELPGDPPRLLMGNVGDSRGYLIRDGELHQVTRDHTGARELAELGVLEAAGPRHPAANMLTRAIGAAPEISLELADALSLCAGDGILLCSDGLSSYVSAQTIAQVLCETRDPDAAVQRLVHIALEQGSRDNISIQYLRLAEAAAGIHVGGRIGSYTLERRLGTGGMADVWLGRDIALNTLAAIKIIQPSIGQDDEERARFLQEGQRQAGLRHPAIVRVLEYKEGPPGTEPAAYMVLDYVDGGSLEARLHAWGESPLSEPEFSRIAFRVLDALEFAHAHKLVHRDVKPANILLDREGNAFLGDFGLVLPLGAKRLSKTGRMLGTWQYMSPEQIRAGKDLDARSDLYSFGCVLYEMASGKKLFASVSDDVAVIRAHLQERPEELKDVRPEIQAVIFRALEKDRRDRWQTCAEFRTALEGALMGIRPEGPKWTARRFVARHPRALGLAGTAIVAAGVAFAIAVVWRQGNEAVRAEKAKQALQLQDRETKRRIAVAHTIARDSVQEYKNHNLTLAALLALESIRGHQTREGIESLQQALIWLGEPGKELPGNNGRVTSVAWAPDGKSLASVSKDGTILVREWPNGRTLFKQTVSEPGGAEHTDVVAWSIDGPWLASTAGKNIYVWDTRSGKRDLVLEGHTAKVNGLAWYPGDRYLVSASDDRTVKVWDRQSGKTTHTFETGPDDRSALCVAFPPSYQWLSVTTGSGKLLLWNARDFSAAPKVYQLRNSPIKTCAWSPKGEKLVWAGGWDFAGIGLWTDLFTEGKTSIWELSTPGAGALSWNRDAERLASASPDRVFVWPTDPEARPHNFHPIETFELESSGNRLEAAPAAWSPDGTSVAYGWGNGGVRVSRAGGNPLVRTILGHQSIAWTLFWSSDSRRLITGSDTNGQMVWDTATGALVEKIASLTFGAYSAETGQLATTSRDFKAASIQNLATGKKRKWNLSGWRIPASWNKDGSRIAWRAGSSAKGPLTATEIRDTANDRIQLSLPPGFIAWGPGDRRIAIIPMTRENETVPRIEVYDTQSGKLLTTLHTSAERFMTAAWSPDGARIAGGDSGGNVTVWDAGTGNRLWSNPTHADEIWSLGWSADGTRLASGAYAEINIWGAANGERLRTLEATFGRNIALAWSRDGRLAVASSDGTVKIFVMDGNVILKSACGLLYRNMTQDEYTSRIFEIAGLFRDLGGVPQEPAPSRYRKTCESPAGPPE